MSCGSKKEDRKQREKEYTGLMECLESRTVRGRDRERERERKKNKKTILQKTLTRCIHMCSMNMFYTSPRRTDRSTIVLQCSLRAPTLTPKIYSSRHPGSLHRTGLTDRSQPIRSSASSADPTDVELVSQQTIPSGWEVKKNWMI